jgi:RecQ family ATP-dependent DNA helicase
MNDSFSLVWEAIESGRWGNFLQYDGVTEPYHRRLLKALAGMSGEYEPSAIELVGLVRHFLRREDEKNPGENPHFLRVPRSYPYPTDADLWNDHGIDILQENPQSFLISARPWQPTWLTYEESPEKDAFAEIPRRDYLAVEGDKFLQTVGLTHYRSVAQKEAIRAILTAPANATLLINLPTGSGKSLCALIPAMLKGGVTIVVVPTVALAIDQEQSLQSLVPHPTAYYSDDSPDGQQRRGGIRQRIREGTQRIVFTSPESVVGSLSSSIYTATRRGYLNYFILDEVHLVEQWGDDFRPVFQELPGLLRDLSRIHSFSTILLTATLTESCLETIETLFRGSGEFRVLSAVQLRPEPAYWFAKCSDRQEKQQRLLEAIDHLPRPMIIYTSRKEDAYRLRDRLKKEGYRRFDVMTGDSSGVDRARLIDRWREKNIDIVIATSAFGLGMDQQDVRTVIHFCIPETIDRFYQEVGRGGRDGNASISLTLYTEEDKDTADFLNQKNPITEERGRQRWISMFGRKESLTDGRYCVDLTVPPSLADGDIDMNNPKNREWNGKTLTLMSQGGLIQLDWQSPPRLSGTDDRTAYETYQNTRVIQILNEYHSQPETWENYIEPIRQKRIQNNRQSLQLVCEALAERPARCLAEIFQEAYTVPGTRSRPKIHVSAACGGCPRCRQDKRSPFSQPQPHPRPVWQNPDFSLSEPLQRISRGESLIGIFYNSSEKVTTLVNWFLDRGMINVVSPVPLEDAISEKAIAFIEREYQPFTLYPVPTLIYLPPSYPLPSSYLGSASFFRVILLPESTPDPERIDRRLIDVFPGRGFRLSVFCQEVNL